MKKKKKSPVSLIVILIALGLMAYSLYNLIPILMDYYKSEKSYTDLAEQVLVIEHNDDASETVEKDPDWWYEDVNIDFEKMHEINQDVIGWIRFDDIETIGVNYPILYSGDDETYLRHDLYHKYYVAGSIFLEGENHPDFMDPHSIIYGHNMRTATMFGGLKKYKNDEDCYENNQYFTIYTENAAYRYQIFSYHDDDPESEIYAVGFVHDDNYQSFLNSLVNKSKRDTGIHPTLNDRIVTLSTCTGQNSSMRFVVHAVCVDEKKYNK